MNLILNEDMLFKVFSNLSGREIGKICTVCKLWENIVRCEMLLEYKQYSKFATFEILGFMYSFSVQGTTHKTIDNKIVLNGQLQCFHFCSAQLIFHNQLINSNYNGVISITHLSHKYVNKLYLLVRQNKIICGVEASNKLECANSQDLLFGGKYRIVNISLSEILYSEQQSCDNQENKLYGDISVMLNRLREENNLQQEYIWDESEELSPEYHTRLSSKYPIDEKFHSNVEFILEEIADILVAKPQTSGCQDCEAANISLLNEF